MNYFKEKFKNTPQTRKLLFGRESLKDESIFEEILSNADLFVNFANERYRTLLDYVWNEFKLWKKPEILIMVSNQVLHDKIS